MCVRTNSSYSPRLLISSSAFTNRRRSVRGQRADVLTRVRHGVPPCACRAACGPSVAQPLPRSELVDGRAGRLQRGRVGAVVVDHAQPGAVGAAHQVQRAAVDGDLPLGGAGRGGGSRRDEDPVDAPAPVGLVEGGAGGCRRSGSARAAGRRRRPGRAPGRRRPEQPAQQRPAAVCAPRRPVLGRRLPELRHGSPADADGHGVLPRPGGGPVGCRALTAEGAAGHRLRPNGPLGQADPGTATGPDDWCPGPCSPAVGPRAYSRLAPGRGSRRAPSAARGEHARLGELQVRQAEVVGVRRGERGVHGQAGVSVRRSAAGASDTDVVEAGAERRPAGAPASRAGQPGGDAAAAGRAAPGAVGPRRSAGPRAHPASAAGSRRRWWAVPR